MSLWQERALQNEEIFRAVNQDIARLEARYGDAKVLQLVCECVDPTCTDRFAIDAETYREVREHLMRFLVVPGHEDPSVESVVETGDAYLVVEKQLDDD